MSKLNNNHTIVITAIFIYVILLNYLPLESQLTKGLSLFIFIAILWLTEAIHLSVTALLIPFCAVITGIFELKMALANFSHPIIYLFLGGFTLAAALKKQQLDKVIADKVIHLAKGRLFPATLLIFVTTAILSMWVSNTATTALMLPLALGILAQLNLNHDKRLYTFFLLGLAYSASIGGISTLVGSPPNAIVASEMGLDFYGWMKFGVPATLILFPVVLFTLWFLIRPDLDHTFEYTVSKFQLTNSRVITILIFITTASLWIFSRPISNLLGGVSSFDSLVALMAIALIGISRVAEWKDINKTTDWGVLILFGGGLTLSAILKSTGVSDYIAGGISDGLLGMNTWIIIAAIAAFVVFLTELSSNTASAAVLIPIFVPVAEALGVPPLAMAATIGIAASCAFMLPVATPPNAIVFGTGQINLREMMRIGFVLNLLCIVILIFISRFF